MPDLLHLLWYGNIGAQLVVLGRLLFLRLIRQFRWFALYLALSTLQGLLLRLGANRTETEAYWLLWAWTDPVVLLFLIFVVGEAYALITQSFLGLGPLGRWFLIISISASVAVCAAIAIVDAPVAKPQATYLHLLFVIKRCVGSILAGFLICAAAMFFRFKEPVKRNVIVHCRILTGYCMAIATGYFAANVGGTRDPFSEFVLGACTACLLLWTVLLSRGGEELPPAPPISPEDRDRVRRWNDDVLAAGRWLVRHRP